MKPVFSLAVFVGCCLSIAASVASPTITTNPESSTLMVNGLLNIQCDSGDATLDVVLRIDNVDVIPASNMQVTESGGLDMKNFTFAVNSKEDNGLVFTCYVQDAMSSSPEVTLTVLFPPNISEIMDVTEVEGQSATVMFTVDANPAIATNNVSISPSRSPAPVISVNGTSVTVEFENVQESDNTTYTVTVVNDIGSDMEMFNIIVNNAQSITTSVMPSRSATVSTMSNTVVPSNSISGTSTVLVPSNSMATAAGNSSQDLGAGEIAGIIIGAVIFVVVVALVAAFVIYILVTKCKGPKA